MAVPVIASTTESTGSSTSTTVTMPATRPDGDIFCAIGVKDDDDAWSSVDAAWGTAVFDISTGAAVRHTMWVWKGASEPASYSIGHDDELTNFTVLRITGGNADDIIEAFGTATGDGVLATAPEVTPTNGNTLALRTFGVDRSTISSLPTTISVEVDSGGVADVSLGVSFANGPAAGIGSGTATCVIDDDPTNRNWCAATVCINEAAASGILKHPGMSGGMREMLGGMRG